MGARAMSSTTPIPTIWSGSTLRTDAVNLHQTTRRRPEVRALARLEGHAKQSSFEARRRWLAPPAITAKPLRRGDGFSAVGPQITKHDQFQFSKLAVAVLRH